MVLPTVHMFEALGGYWRNVSHRAYQRKKFFRGNFFLGQIFVSGTLCCHLHGRMGRKKLGGPKEICPTFPDCARPLPKRFLRNKLISATSPPPPPPSPKKFRLVYRFRGSKIFPDIQNFYYKPNSFFYKPIFADC